MSIKVTCGVKFRGMEAGVASAAARSHAILLGLGSSCWKSPRRPLFRQRNLQMTRHYGACALLAFVNLRFCLKLSSLPRRLANRSRMHAQPNLESVLTFWFGDEVLHARERLSDTGYLRERTKMWYLSGSRYDEMARGFLPLVKQEHRFWQRKELWAKISESENLANLARVVLFDQIPRNACRGTPDAFRYDQYALEVSEKLVEDGYSDSCSAAELLCLVQPFSHSEVPGDASRVDMGIEILQKNMQRFEDGTSKVIFQAARCDGRGIPV